MPSAVFDGAVFVAFHEIRMVFDEDGSRPAMVVDEIEHDQQAEAVGDGDETAEVVVRAVFGIGREVVFDTIRAVGVVHLGGVLAVRPEFRPRIVVRRHLRAEIDDVDAERSDMRQHACGGLQRAFGRERPEEQLVDDGAFHIIGNFFRRCRIWHANSFTINNIATNH